MERRGRAAERPQRADGGCRQPRTFELSAWGVEDHSQHPEPPTGRHRAGQEGRLHIGGDRAGGQQVRALPALNDVVDADHRPQAGAQAPALERLEQ
jgi:hypothetical protein